MALISSSIPNLVNGVSQQPYTLRIPSQSEEQINGYSTTSAGLLKRPPTKHIGALAGFPTGDSYIHTINRDASERYKVVVSNGDLKVYNLDGVEQTVSFPNGKSYLATATPSTSIAAATLADYTFIVNKEKKVLQSVADSPSRPFEALVNVKVGNFGKTYKVFIDGSLAASYTTPDGSQATHTAQLSTDHIALELYNQLTGTGNATSSTLEVTNITPIISDVYTAVIPGRDDNDTTVQITNYVGATFNLPVGVNLETCVVLVGGVSTKPTSHASGFVVYFPATTTMPTITAYSTATASASAGISISGSLIYYTKSVDFTITGEDGFNGNALDIVKGRTQKFATLPAKLDKSGFIVEVAGEPTSSSDNYWVRYEKGTSGQGVWKETIAPGIPIGSNNTTMPHVLIRKADGTFSFQTGSWLGRTVGDMKSAPNLSFIGNKITNVFFYRNRLGFLSADSVILSEAGEFFNFFPTTVTALLDSDPIDITISHTSVSHLLHVCPFNKKLLLFSDRSQFLLESGDLLTPKTVSTQLVTEYDCSSLCTPVLSGSSVYFPVTAGNFSLVREYYADTNTEGHSAQNISEHVPKYLPKNIRKISVGSNNDILFLYSPETPNTLYVYKYYWNGQEKLQSSWSKWVFGTADQVLDVAYLDSTLYLVIRRPEGVYLESMDIALRSAASPEPFLVHLDRKAIVAPASLSFADGFTTITGPYQWTGGSYCAVVGEGSSKKAGVVVNVDSSGKIQGDYTGCTLIVGRKYEFFYKFSTLTLRDSNGPQGMKADNVAKLQMRYMQINYAETGYFKVDVTPVGRTPYEYVFTGKILGTPSSYIGQVNLQTGNYRFPLMGKNTNLEVAVRTDSPLPCALLSADWEGFYVKRSQGV